MTQPMEMENDPALLAAAQQTKTESLSAPLPAPSGPREQFDEKQGFVRKVMGIVTSQLFVTFLGAFIASVSADFGSFCQNPATMTFSLVGLIAGMLFALCLGRKVPWDYLGLLLFTLSMSLLLSAVTANVDWQLVLSAIAITMVMSLGLCIFSLMANHQQLCYYMVFVLCLWVVEFVVALLISLGHSEAKPFYYSLCALLYGTYLVLDIYRLKSHMDIDDYIPAAIIIYIDIIRIFLYILAALSKKKK